MAITMISSTNENPLRSRRRTDTPLSIHTAYNTGIFDFDTLKNIHFVFFANLVIDTGIYYKYQPNVQKTT